MRSDLEAVSRLPTSWSPLPDSIPTRGGGGLRAATSCPIHLLATCPTLALPATWAAGATGGDRPGSAALKWASWR